MRTQHPANRARICWVRQWRTQPTVFVYLLSCPGSAEDLPAFNAAIVGEIEVTAEFT
jgi:hypothetical protein